ncbi:MAG: hypothetical protein DWQ30_24260 [Acidobacteria bacterium]|nr:MAG: hypothetical protein DWQ30_24260 [Acidobacteriota bacterium]
MVTWPQGVDVGPAHADLPSLDELLEALDHGAIDLDDLRRLGLAVFSTPFNTYDGFGEGPFDPSETDTRAFGHRPTLQGNGLSLRVNGLDAQSCNECHTIVSNRTTPPTLGFGGVGGVVQNAIILPKVIDVADSFDDRVVFQPGHDPEMPLQFDGVADFDGRYANPPFLFGGGAVELLGKEMTADLQDLLAQARLSPPGTVTPLLTHGVDFGAITTVDSAGNVELDVEGIGPEDAHGVPPEEVLVVRPFGRKGETFSMRDFDRGAMQFHFGIQPDEVVGAGVDEDGDGLSDEVTVAEMSVLHVFDVTNPAPRIGNLGPAALAGFDHFVAIGCADCHIPVLETRSKEVPLAHPEVATDPSANVYLEIDLRPAGFDTAAGGGLQVPLFADLKRHAMGPRLAETFSGGEIANDEFTTARLWGVADTAPYLHDGRATTLYQAIEMHGGEAQAARDAFLASDDGDQRKLLRFLGKLRTPRRPNKELLK